MAKLEMKNNAGSTLAATITTGATSISVQTGDGTKFPAIVTADNKWFPVTLQDASGNVEICYCTDVTGDTLTVTRAREGTTAFAFVSGAKVSHRATAAVFADLSVLGLPDFVADQFWQVNSAATAVESKSASDFRTAIAAVGTSDLGTSANKVVQLDGSARLPAVDGSQLTGLSAGLSAATAAQVRDRNLDNVAVTPLGLASEAVSYTGVVAGGGTLWWSWDQGKFVQGLFSGTTGTISAIPADMALGHETILLLANTVSQSWALTWPSTILWGAAGPPSTTATAYDYLVVRLTCTYVTGTTRYCLAETLGEDFDIPS